MITFLNCDTKIFLSLGIKISNLTPNGYEDKVYMIKPNNDYTITAVDSENNHNCIKSYNCKIIGFHISDKEIYTSFVNLNNTELKDCDKNSKNTNIDYIKIDYSEEGKSQIKCINISDIRDIKEFNNDDGIDLQYPIEQF